MSIFAVASMGCGGSSDRAIRVAGEVTYKGQPVPYGDIVFDPDLSAGGSGPQGTATITNGRFDTGDRGMGLAGGNYVVHITGFSSAPDVTSETNSPKPLFPEKKIKKEFKASSTNEKFTIE
ncbi:MAG: hypothetical protein IT423_13790 [Pirellulaceae bacterium]|nr:hypothetical protein [Pirellulaceae bacterium]